MKTSCRKHEWQIRSRCSFEVLSNLPSLSPSNATQTGFKRETSDGIGCPLCLLSSRLQARMCVNWSGTEAVAMGTKKGDLGVWPRLVLCSQSQRCILVKMLRGSKTELYVYHIGFRAVCTSESQIMSEVI